MAEEKSILQHYLEVSSGSENEIKLEISEAVPLILIERQTAEILNT